MIRFYLIPIQRVQSYRGPKYLKWRMNAGGMDVLWSMKDYGLIDQSVVACDVTAEQHNTLAGYADVYAFPENLDAAMTQAQRLAIGNYLEGIVVPADWLSPQDSFRTALRTITGMYLFMQRLTAILNASPLTLGWTLNTKLGDLSASEQAAIVEAFSRHGDPGILDPNKTLRVILKAAADLWGGLAIGFGFVTL